MAKTHKYSDCIVEHSMLNGLKMNLKNAIEYAGISVSNSECLWQYPEIIKNNLVAKSINNINLLGKDIIKISRTTDENEIIYNVSTVFDTKDIERPNYASASNNWSGEMSVDSVFKDLFENILPSVRGIHAGGMTKTDLNGADINSWNNTLFNKTGNKIGLYPNANYLRLYLTCQAEPLYIFISSSITDITGGYNYNISNSDTVNFNIDEENTLTAHVSCITNEQIEQLIK
jgi:hypothetical protein